MQPEPAALVRFRLHPDSATHASDRFADNRQSNARSWVGLFVINTLENSEYSFLSVFCYTDAIVYKPKTHLMIRALAPDTDLRLSAGGDELHCVIQEIGNALCEVRFVTTRCIQGEAEF